MVNTWILVLCCLITLSYCAPDEPSDRDTVANALVGYIKRKSAPAEPRRGVVHLYNGRRSVSHNRRKRESEKIPLLSNQIKTNIRKPDIKQNSLLKSRSDNYETRRIVVPPLVDMLSDYDYDSDSKDSKSNCPNCDSSSSKSTESSHNSGDKSSDSDCIDTESGDGNNSGTNGGDEDNNSDNDDSQTGSDCGTFGCGEHTSWKQAPERVWQGVKSGLYVLADWTVYSIRGKHGRGQPIEKGYTDSIFGINYL